MTERVFSGTLDLTRLQAIVDALRHSARFAIVERIDAIDFPPPQTEPIDVREWPKGRIFDEPFELRWEQLGQEYRVIVAGEEDLPVVGSGLNEQDLQLGVSESPSYYCWNEKNPRLGRTLNYRCVPGKGDVKLTVREYRDDHGRLVFWRYVTMERDGGEQ
jgi:hypothetical protein